MKQVTLTDGLILLLVVNGWAFNVVAMKIGMMELPPLLMLSLRFMVVAAVLVPFHPIRLRQVPLLILLAFTFGFIHFALLMLGMRYTDAGSAAVLVQMGTPVAMILAAMVLKEPLGWRQLCGVGLALLGVMVLAGSPALSSWKGPVLLLISAAGWACTNIIVKRSNPLPALTMTGWLSLFAIPFAGLSSWFSETNQLALLMAASWRGWLGVFYSAFGSSLLAYSLWYWLVKRYPVNQILPWSLLSPALAVVIGGLVLGERLDLLKLSGAALIVGGILLSIVRRRAGRSG